VGRGTMTNKILEDIKEYAKKRLMAEYGYCGVAEHETLAMINCDDGNGGDIKIEIKITEEK